MAGFSNSTTPFPASWYQEPAGTGANNYGTTIYRAEATTNTQALTTANVHFASIVTVANTTITKLSFVTGATAPTAVTYAWLGLYDSSYRLVAATADFSTTMAATAANTVLTISIASTAAGAATSYTIPSTGLYYIGLNVAGTGLGTIWHANSNTAITALAPVTAARAAAVAAPAYPTTIGAQTAVGFIPYFFATA